MMYEDHVTFNFNLNVTPRGKSRGHPLNRTCGLVPAPQKKESVALAGNQNPARHCTD